MLRHPTTSNEYFLNRPQSQDPVDSISRHSLDRELLDTAHMQTGNLTPIFMPRYYFTEIRNVLLANPPALCGPQNLLNHRVWSNIRRFRQSLLC